MESCSIETIYYVDEILFALFSVALIIVSFIQYSRIRAQLPKSRSIGHAIGLFLARCKDVVLLSSNLKLDHLWIHYNLLMSIANSVFLLQLLSACSGFWIIDAILLFLTAFYVDLLHSVGTSTAFLSIIRLNRAHQMHAAAMGTPLHKYRVDLPIALSTDKQSDDPEKIEGIPIRREEQKSNSTDAGVPLRIVVQNVNGIHTSDVQDHTAIPTGAAGLPGSPFTGAVLQNGHLTSVLHLTSAVANSNASPRLDTANHAQNPPERHEKQVINAMILPFKGAPMVRASPTSDFQEKLEEKLKDLDVKKIEKEREKSLPEEPKSLTKIEEKKKSVKVKRVEEEVVKDPFSAYVLFYRFFLIFVWISTFVGYFLVVSLNSRSFLSIGFIAIALNVCILRYIFSMFLSTITYKAKFIVWKLLHVYHQTSVGTRGNSREKQVEKMKIERILRGEETGVDIIALENSLPRAYETFPYRVKKLLHRSTSLEKLSILITILAVGVIIFCGYESYMLIKNPISEFSSNSSFHFNGTKWFIWVISALMSRFFWVPISVELDESSSGFDSTPGTGMDGVNGGGSVNENAINNQMNGMNNGMNVEQQTAAARKKFYEKIVKELENEENQQRMQAEEMEMNARQPKVNTLMIENNNDRPILSQNPSTHLR